VLDGLDEEYDSIVELVHERGMPSHDMYSRPLSTVQRIESCRGSAPQAHAACFGGKPYQPSSSGLPAAYQSGPTPPKPTYTPRPNSAGSSSTENPISRPLRTRSGLRTGAGAFSHLMGRPVELFNFFWDFLLSVFFLFCFLFNRII
jgi:hypothetical protein